MAAELRKVKILVPRVGVTENGVAWSHEKGDEIELPASDAADAVKAKHAHYVEPYMTTPAKK